MNRISVLALALSLSLSLAACGDDGGDGDVLDCESSTLSYDNFGSQFMTNFCLDCHASTVTGGARNGAPVAVNFDDLSLVQAQAGRIKARVNASSLPPPSFPAAPSATERSDLTEWIDCGTN